MRHPPQLLADVVLHRLGGEGADGLLLRLGRPALVAKGAENPLQDEVDEAAVGRRVKPRRAAVLGLQAVAEEVGEVAGLILVHPGGGHGHFLSVQGLHRLGREAAPGPACRLVQAAKEGLAGGFPVQGGPGLRVLGCQGSKGIGGRGRGWPVPPPLGKEGGEGIYQEGGPLSRPPSPWAGQET